ncbi:response regulator [Gordonia zhaorongruii]|uniref:response regulator n=1 Tax=Gordonia zhaorongruii TaxID=2597659 RepID=UPI001047BED1|nr:response regulator transcription factor [Gordonia zhaorongruii]
MRLLLIEDDPQIVEALQMSLERLDYDVSTIDTGTSADLHSLVERVDAVVLDIGLPDTDGFSVCRSIRARSAIPVIMLTARSDEIDMVAGLEAGADDYVVKPVSPRVLDARIKAIMRRIRPNQAPHEPPSPPDAAGTANAQFDVNGLSIDRAAAQVRRDGSALPLSPTELRLMFAFADHAGQVLSRDQLLTLAWDQTYLGDSRLVDNAIQRLRSKIDPVAGPSLIETVRGFGYRFAQ